MFQLPEIKPPKKPRPAYRKSEAVKALEQLYMTDHRKRYPNMPEYARTCKKYEDRTANGLSRCIIDFIQLNGGQAERINCTGRYIDNSQVFTDVVGRTRSIGSGRWIPTSGSKGTADISATIRGRSVKIEVKIGKDRMSEDQRNYQQKIEAAGGLYFIARNFTEFKTWFETITR